MFTFKYFNIPKTLSRDYCKRALQSLEKVIPSTSSGWTKKPQKGIIHLIVIDEADMAGMNEKFRGKTGPTDILTFSYYSPNLKPTDIAGEIYLCLEKIKLYAKDRWVMYKEQLEYIVIHGLVHLMGYNHETEKQAREMERIEKRVVGNIS